MTLPISADARVPFWRDGGSVGAEGGRLLEDPVRGSSHSGAPRAAEASSA
jgi:hypothetical protein